MYIHMNHACYSHHQFLIRQHLYPLCLHMFVYNIDIVHVRPACTYNKAFRFSLAVNSSSPNTADVPHVTMSVTMFPVTSLLLVGTVLYLDMFSVTAFSGNGWFSRGRNRVTEPLAWLTARDWTVSAVKSATCTPSTSTVYHSVG